MENYIYDDNKGLWYKLHEDDYLSCMVIQEEESCAIGI